MAVNILLTPKPDGATTANDIQNVDLNSFPESKYYIDTLDRHYRRRYITLLRKIDTLRCTTWTTHLDLISRLFGQLRQ